MMKHSILAGIAVAMLTLSACNDETLNIGNTLTQQTDKLLISSADYNVSTKTVLADSVLFRSSYCYLGHVKDPETGAYITSEFMTQFYIPELFSLPYEEDIASIYNGTVEGESRSMAGADSCYIELYMKPATSITDTLAALKIRLTELNRPMEETRKYYSNFDPVEEGYVDGDCMSTDKMFSYNDLTVKDSLRALSTYYHNIRIGLNKPYEKDGITYNNYGTYIMQQYYRHPEYFKNAYTRIENVCPGFFVSVIDGEGVYTEIPDMALRLYFRNKNSNDSVVHSNTALAGTEEVLQTTKISNERNVLKELEAINSCTYIKAPAGLFTEVILPVDDIFQDHNQDSIMTAKISFQRINNDSYDNALRIPTYIMMLPKDSLYTFFENKMTPDYKMSYYTTYLNSSGGNSTNQYTFSNISYLLTSLWNAEQEGLIAERDSILSLATSEEMNTIEKNERLSAAQFSGAASDLSLKEQISILRSYISKASAISSWHAVHENWDKVLLVPVQQISSSSTSTTTSTSSTFENCMDIVSTKLVGGSQNPYALIKISIVYGKFNQ